MTYFICLNEEKETRHKQINFSFSIVVFSLLIIMTGYYANHDNVLNEARNVISQKNSDDLNKLMTNEDEVTRFIGNLNEVRFYF